MLTQKQESRGLAIFALIVITALWGQWIYIKVASLYQFLIIFYFGLFVLEDQYLDISLQNPVTRFLTFWLVESMVSCIWAPDRSLAFRYVYNIFLIYGMNYILNCCFRIKDIKKYIVLFTITLFCLNLIAIWEVTTGNHLVKTYLSGEHRARVFAYMPAGFFNNPNDFAVYIYQLFPFSLAALCLESKTIKGISIINIPLTVFVILKTESRTLLLLLCVTLSIYVLFFMNKRHYFKIIVLAAVTIIVVTNIFPEYMEIFKSGMDSISGDEIAASADGGSLGSRINLIGNGLMMLVHSFGMGVGAGCHRVLMSNFSKMYFDVHGLQVMHNLTMELFADYGLLVGFSFFSAIKTSTTVLFQMYRNTKVEHLRILSAMLMINMATFIIIGICSSSIVQLTSAWTIFCFIGILVDNNYSTNMKRRAVHDGNKNNIFYNYSCL